MKSEVVQRKRRITTNQKKVLEAVLEHRTGIYQSVIAVQKNIKVSTVMQIVKKFEKAGLVIKEHVGKERRITPKNTEAIQQLLKNRGNGNNSEHSVERIKKEPVEKPLQPIKPLSLDDDSDDTFQIRSLKDQTISLIPESKWKRDFSEETEEGSGEDNWTEDVRILSIDLFDKQVENGLKLLTECMANGKKMRLQKLLTNCSISLRNVPNFLIMLAVMVNDENAKRNRNGETNEIIQEITIEGSAYRKYISIKAGAV